MKIIILGIDGYIGFPLAIKLMREGHTILGVDNLSRRARVNSVGGNSITPIESPMMRDAELSKQFSGLFSRRAKVSLGEDNPNYILRILDDFQPATIVHLGEQPSAPWSMISPYQAAETQIGNVIGTLHVLWAMHSVCPDAHLIKLGTMGEYGTPDCDIPEGVIPKWGVGKQNRYQSDCPNTDGRCGGTCPMSGLLFPRQPGSFYHISKVHDTYNVEFACRNWGLRSTDIMQGVLFGLNNEENPRLLTRFDYDEYFGTVINRFCAQALIGHPLTVYGKGNQTRGYLTLKDALQCLTIAIENPPKPGEYRTWNQFESLHSVNDLAGMVQDIARKNNYDCSTNHIPNPRKEAEDHYYNPTVKTLFDLGFEPDRDIYGNIELLFHQLIPFKSRISPAAIMPKTNWR